MTTNTKQKALGAADSKGLYTDTNGGDYTNQFKTAIAVAGLVPPNDVVADGKLHRFSSDGNARKKNGWYIMFADGLAAGRFGCWAALPEGATWCDKSRDTLTEAERQQFRERMETAKAQREQAAKELQAEAKAKCAQLWRASRPCADGEHPYLVTKGVKPYGVNLLRDSLLIPLRADKELVSLQFIGADGTKRFKTGGQVQGAYFAIGKPAGAVVVCEGWATGASIHEATGYAVAVAFNAGNLLAVAKVLRDKLPEAKIIIAADDDAFKPVNAGLSKATEAARIVGGLLAVPDFGADRPEGATDFNDLHQIAGLQAVKRCIDAATVAAHVISEQNFMVRAVDSADAWPELQPLIAKIDAEEYPLDALPVAVRCAVEEVAGFVKAPVPLIAASALAALSLSIQAHVDVQRAEKLSGPCGLFMLAIADSGERKSTCDSFFIKAIRDYQDREQEVARPLFTTYKSEHDAWDAKRNGLKEKIKELAKKSTSTTTQEKELFILDENEPIPPKVPNLILGDSTPEALLFDLAKKWPSGGVVSSEAGSVFGGHAMGADSVMRNLATLNQLWDGAALSISRRSSESYTVRGARLTMALQVQEATIRAFFNNTKGLARGTGFLARFLISWPKSTQGTRTFTEAPSNWPALAAFNDRLTAILNRQAPVDDAGALVPAMLTLTPDAKAAWVAFHDAIESMLSSGGELYDVRDIASKTADNAARLAALFHTFSGSVGPIDLDALEAAARIAAWHLGEARRFLGELAMPEELANPARLEAWLIDYCKREKTDKVPTREVQRMGPNGLRSKQVFTAAVQELAELGRARMVQDGKKKLIQVNSEVLA